MQQIVFELMIAVMNSRAYFSKRYGCQFPRSPAKFSLMSIGLANALQRLMGASLLVFLNKTDVEGCMTEDEVREVSCWRVLICSLGSTDIN
jgi:hypothetical protein